MFGVAGKLQVHLMALRITPVSCDCYRLVVGRASSMAAVLSAAGEPGFRTAMPHARIMIHEITSGHGRSKITDLRIRMKNSEVHERLAMCFAVSGGVGTFRGTDCALILLNVHVRL